MTAGRTKLSYLTNYGISPHLKSVLDEKIVSEDQLVLLFDEAYNEELGQKQLDIHVRLWIDDMVSKP